MKLKVPDIPEEGMNVVISTSPEIAAHDTWFKKVIEEAFPEQFPKGGRADLNIHVLRTSDNVQISGDASVDLKPSCDRCLESFDKNLGVPLHVNLAPHRKMEFGEGEGEDDAGLDEDDVAFSFYKGEEIDLSDIVQEMILLDIPLRYLCSEDCKGLCPQCGSNLNTGTCACAEILRRPPFRRLETTFENVKKRRGQPFAARPDKARTEAS